MIRPTAGGKEKGKGMNFIAVDIGSTFIKAAIYDLTGNQVVFTQKCPTPAKAESPDPHRFEVSAEEIVSVVRGIIEKCMSVSGNIAGILFSTQQHGCVLHHPQLPRDMYISWQDTRCLKQNPRSGKSYMEELSELLPPEIMRRTGVPVKPALALCNLYALFCEEALSRQGKIRLYTLGSYVIEKLTGNNICHITNAAPMGFVNLPEKSWDHDILSRAGLDFLQLPELIADLRCCGVCKISGTELPVYPDLGDVQTSVYGTGAASGDMIVNIGTSGQLIMIRDEYDPGEYEIRPYYDGNYCYVVSRMPGGRNLDVQIDYIRAVGERIFGITLDKGEIWNRIENNCVISGSGGLEVDCSFYEIPDRLADGKILHITHTNFTPENVLAATAEDYGRMYRKYAEILCKGRPFPGTLFFSGGAVLKNRYLSEVIAKAMGISRVINAQQDEVYGGLFRLAKRCPAKDEREENTDAV